MSLILKVVTFKGQPPPVSMTLTFGREGGTIGRSDKNSFVLPDPDRYISREHALILYENGFYYLKDTSLSGSYVRNRKILLHQNKIQLEDGDRIEIGDYELLVGLENLQETECIAIPPLEGEPPAGASDESEACLEPAADKEKKYGDFEDAVKFINRKIEEAASKRPVAGVADSLLFPNEISEIFVDNDDAPSENDSESARPDPESEPLFLESEGLSPKIESEDLSQLDPAQADLAKALEKEPRPPTTDDAPFINEEKEESSQGADSSADADSGALWMDVSENIDFDKILIGFQTFVGELPPITPAGNDVDIRIDLDQKIDGGDSGSALIRDGKEAPSDSNRSPVPQSRSRAELFEIFLKAAGIEDDGFYGDDDVAELMQTAGFIFRELVEGLVLLNNGRAEAKNQLRMEGTILGPIGNNPLKFSSNLEETLKILLGKKQVGFISGIQAVRESHADIIGHQLAMTVGIQAALQKALKRFDPEHYIQRYRKSLFFLKKNKCWDAYRNDYGNIVIKTLENFLDEEFVRAYEEQIEKMNQSESKE